MRRLACTVLLATAGIGYATTAHAGSLGDFNDSYQETQSENASADDDDDSDDDTDIGTAILEGLTEPDCDDWDETCEDHDAGLSSSPETSSEDHLPGIVRMLIGATPGAGFSLGRAPYDGRGTRPTGELGEHSDSALVSSESSSPRRTFDSRVTDHRFQWTLRSNALTTSKADAAGGEIYAQLTSSSSPGFAFSYQYAHEFQSSSDLGLGYLVYQPNLALTKWLTATWSMGIGAIHSADGIGNAGATAGGSFELFPVEPLLFAGRANLYVFPNVMVGDLRGAAGVFVSDHVAIEGNVRHLKIAEGAGLTMFGLGLRTYYGF